MIDLSKYYKNSYIRIFIILSIAYWPVLFCVFSLKWDAMNISVPWRYFISTIIQQGELPLWYPNQLFGMTQYLDPQTWYWPAWIFGIFGYTNITLHLEFMLHIYLAAIGCYKLCKHLGINPTTALVTGLIYSMSGFFIGNAQHIGWIVSAAWIPIVIYQFLLFVENVNLKSTIGLSLSLYLYISGGYWSFIVTTYYFLILLFVYIIIRKYKTKQLNKIYLKQLILYTALLVILNIITSSVILASLYESINLIDRGKMSIDFTLYGSFHPVDILTLLTPIATYVWKDGFWETDVALINIYIGVFSVFLFFWTIIFQRSVIKINYKLLLLAFFVLTLSMGYSFPLRAWFSEYIPLFDHFRFPSAYRIYFILILCIIIGRIIDNLDINHPRYKKSIIVYGIMLSIISVFLISIYHTSIIKFLHHFIPKPTKFPRPLLFTLQFLISAFFVLSHFIIIRYFSSKGGVNLLKRFIIIELVTISLLTLPNTVVNISQQPTKIYSTIKKIEKLNNDSLLLNSTLNQITEYSKKVYPFGSNAATFSKLTSNTQYSSYIFKSTKKLLNDTLYEKISNRPLAYITKNQDSISKLRKIKSITLLPNQIKLEIEKGNDSTLYLSQNYHKNWKCYINNNDVPISIANISLMKVNIPKEQSEVIFSFEAPFIRSFFWISILVFIIQLAFLITTYIKNKSIKKG